MGDGCLGMLVLGVKDGLGPWDWVREVEVMGGQGAGSRMW